MSVNYERATEPSSVNNGSDDNYLGTGLSEEVFKIIFGDEISKDERFKRFNSLWDKVSDELDNDYMLDTEQELMGFTGHRAVDLIETGDLFALGFQIHGRATWDDDKLNDKTITAVWRRIYPEDTILEHYESGVYNMDIGQINTAPQTLDQLEELFELFKNAPAYE